MQVRNRPWVPQHLTQGVPDHRIEPLRTDELGGTPRGPTDRQRSLPGARVVEIVGLVAGTQWSPAPMPSPHAPHVTRVRSQYRPVASWYLFRAVSAFRGSGHGALAHRAAVIRAGASLPIQALSTPSLLPVLRDRSGGASVLRYVGITGRRALSRACLVSRRVVRMGLTVAECQPTGSPVGVGVLAAFRRFVICRPRGGSSTHARAMARTTSASNGSSSTCGAPPGCVGS
jgi:hypothetical protein